ncbi:I78 family peptidase inhibitor [Paracoccus sp. Z330]|uniref:I78 family peptidase inhibitor n=1 Tax=Paracoccus onchidii TaxID=3017813 RepID=A0ABT4ZBI1_9RHOB|nr:I78 family peptidase inhibitor [Paracoccus onchidii]MDB6176725.1 I78 family peptidase inhibitor [Paracoccus onchidii]
MRLFVTLPGAFALALLGACEDPATQRVVADEPADQCGADGYQGLIGHPRDVLDKMTFPIGTRQIGPNDAVTSDFRPDRLNIEYGQTGRIEKISCY